MTRDTRFTATQGIQTTGIIPASGAGTGLTDLANKVRQMAGSEFLKSRVAEAQQAGELAGTQLGFQPPEGSSIAQKAFNEAALKTNKQLVATDIMLKIPQLHKNAIENHPGNIENAMNQFNKTSQQYEQHILQNIPTENRAFAQNYLNYHIGTTNLSLQNRLLKERRIASQGQFTITHTAHINQINDAISNINFSMPKEEVEKQIDGTHSMLNQSFDAINLAQEGGILTSAQGNKLREDDLKNYQNDLIARHYEFALKDGNGPKFLKNIQEKPMRGFDEFQKSKLIGRLKKIGANVVNNSEANKMELLLNAKDYLTSIKDNPKNKNVQTELQIITGLPKRSAFFKDQVKNADFVGEEVQSLKGMTFEQQRKNMEIDKPDPGEPNFLQLNRNWHDIQNRLKQFNHEYNLDKVSALKDNPGVVQALIQKSSQINSGFNFPKLDAIGYKPTTPDPHERMVMAQIVKGTPFDETSVITVPESKDMVNQINGLSVDPRAQINLINAWRQKYGKTFPVAMRDLQKHGGMTFFPMYFASTSPNDPAIPEIETALKSPESDLEKTFSVSQKDDFKLTMSTDNKELNNLIGTYQNFNSFSSNEYVKNLRNTERKLTLAYMVNKGLSASGARSKATEYLTKSFNISSIEGSPVRIPRTFNTTNIRQTAKAYQERLLDKFNFEVPKGWLRSSYLDIVVKNGHWVTNNDNTGLLWIDVNGNPVKNSKGNTFGFTFKDAKDSSNSPEVIKREVKQSKDIKKLNEELKFYSVDPFSPSGLPTHE